ncbi:NlpC/P60 family protein [Kibdelosporangium persicum]|uniref:Cell wall-associated NlpC family hydrolase n=1 Tax=Kibdelosporangium persicum TaxID=2698649 RepID=A0ABX2EV30_9PSEU|nr:NlpC/P60 family protein [Kibdelosporangium persicum]NRN62802.1 Cell wall-associated NlpC family hydrolase [Kibdelosporangium persicum]
MARYSAEQIYAFAREAGFSPDRAATMTAIAMAESGGNDGAHNPHGENSKGLWQINQAAHPHFASVNLFDPVQNARAAFQVSKGGDDISPWTTTHKGSAAKYLKYKEQAQAAAEAYGDGPNRGMWTGVSGYGDHTSAGDARGGGQGVAPTQSSAGSGSDNVNVSQATTTPAGDVNAPAEQQQGLQFGVPLDDDPAAGPDGVQTLTNGVTDPNALAEKQAGLQFGVPLDEDAMQAAQPATSATTATTAQATSQTMGQQQLPAGDGTKVQAFLNAAVAQTGDKYVFGHEVSMGDRNPSTFDCSELVEWAAAQAGVKVPDGSWLQYRDLAKSGTTMSVEQALKTPGALLFSFSSDPMSGGRPSAAHVAISLGNGKTIEAKGTQYGVGSWEANTKRFQYAGYLPEMGAGIGNVPPPPPPPPPTDAFTHRVNTDPAPLDRNPSTVAISHEMTNADPPPAPLPPVPPPPPPPPVEPPVEPPAQPQQQPADDDLDDDNQVDVIEFAQGWVAPADHSLPEHDFGHDPTPGH